MCFYFFLKEENKYRPLKGTSFLHRRGSFREKNIFCFLTREMAPHIDAFGPSRKKQSHESTEASKPGTQETTCPKGYSRFLQLQPEQNQRRNLFKPGKTSIHGIGKEINFCGKNRSRCSRVRCESLSKFSLTWPSQGSDGS